ncbi:6-phosphogluconolactonase [Helicobacter ailurogastricus]|uniref:6-phosphogluconolactonase n=1 Tax=Helicobacter ailurogastricus TaxID=1578720 RepID=A0A0K2X9W5_9HELI|nr:6-phosphogluconolactonase [Helicobacter ailurogastricus]CRF40815.1 6-phosphogluconolactonase, eukaryotic type [Helicobacter ailurogastricus]CRF43292.1 6-phosphogluconolactonase, eukaryotic type [Helicobacter ailurogastricus]CRF44478.1 6-phosphogluconolactonase, eukaryotic type [Helicobacter ailurogastricus]CRF52478.1 6-phosphogluconolactonase, eukaryotic type [Helicobacter ailurogastricus]BDQ29611.1 6-phosphogluconolactonase [Helicobacter ailurogastricus]
MFKLYTFKTPLESAQALAIEIATQLRRMLSIKEQVGLALSGGKSPTAFLQALSQVSLEWRKCRISLVDERVLPLTDPESNALLIHTHFLQNKAQIAPFTPLVLDSSLSTQELLKYAKASYTQPDLAVLGMGADGHTASLFACASEYENALNSQEPIVATTPKNAPFKRLSMSLSALENCQVLFLLISGAEKKAVFERAAQALEPSLPISHLLNSHKVVCHVYCA